MPIADRSNLHFKSRTSNANQSNWKIYKFIANFELVICQIKRSLRFGLQSLELLEMSVYYTNGRVVGRCVQKHCADAL